MNDIYKDLVEYLEAQGVGTSGEDIFAGVQPPDPDDCVALLGLVGSNLGTARDVPALQFPRFQIIVRNQDFTACATKMQDVRDALHGQINLLLTGNRILRMHAEQEGQPIGQDEQGRFEFSMNVNAEYHRNAS